MKKLILYLLIGITAHGQTPSFNGIPLGTEFEGFAQALTTQGFGSLEIRNNHANVHSYQGVQWGYRCIIEVKENEDHIVKGVTVTPRKGTKGHYKRIRKKLIKQYGGYYRKVGRSLVWNQGSGSITLTRKKGIMRGLIGGHITVQYSMLATAINNTNNKAAKENPALRLTDIGSLDNAVSPSSDLANKAVTVTVRPGVATDEAWKRIVFVVSDIFPNLEQSDKSSGWIRSAWELQRYGNVVVRTRIDIKEVPGQDDLRYRVKIESEIGETSCGLDDQCFQPWDRVLKKYDEAIHDLMSSLQ